MFCEWRLDEEWTVKSLSKSSWTKLILLSLRKMREPVTRNREVENVQVMLLDVQVHVLGMDLLRGFRLRGGLILVDKCGISLSFAKGY